MNCCKLYLVPEEVINTWRAEQREQAVDKPVHHLVTQMDSGLSDILNNEDMSDYDKEKLYSQELSKYLTMRQKKREPPLPTPPPMSSSDHQFDSRQLLSSIPKTFRTKAEGLLEYLKADKAVEWDDEGHVYIKDEKVEGSHILDLIHDAIRHRKKVSRPSGWQELSAHLRARNVPKELVGNKQWWEAGYFTPPSRVHKKGTSSLAQQRTQHKETARKMWNKLVWEETASP